MLPVSSDIDHDPPASLGERIRIAREANGWSRAELASRLSTTAATVFRWEEGRSRPRFRQADALARALGRPRAWFSDPAPRSPRGDGDSGRLALVAERVARALAALYGPAHAGRDVADGAAR